MHSPCQRPAILQSSMSCAAFSAVDPSASRPNDWKQVAIQNLLDVRADLRGRRPVEPVRGQDPRRDHQVAVETVALRDRRVTRVDEIVRLHPRRLEADRRAVRGVHILHVHAARARALIPGGLQLLADVERIREVVAGRDHQPVTEAVDALVEEELVLLQRGVGAHSAGGLDQPGLRRDPVEGALEDAVVEARPADRGACRERLRDVAVVAGERPGSDVVRDRMAARVDRLVGRHLLREQRQRGLRSLVVRDVAECLLVAGLRVAVRELRLVRLEVAGDRVHVDRPALRGLGRAGAGAAARGQHDAGHGSSDSESHDHGADEDQPPVHHHRMVRA